MFASKDVFLKSSGGGYSIARSVRLRSSASAYLNRTPASTSNRKTFTWSGWVKRGALSTNSVLFSAGLVSGTFFYSRLYFDSSNNLVFINYPDTASIQATTAGVFRDPAAWYHIACAVDTTQATNSNGVKIWINGVQQTLTFANYTQNADTMFNTTSYTDWVGKFVTGAANDYFDGYMTEVNFIDGQALTPSSFGAIDATTGVWQPTKYSGTYGTNGFYLKFADNSTAAALGTDSSGNSNTWTVNNISVTAGATYDSMTDVPTLTSATVANYAVLNPINTANSPSITNGNLQTTTSASALWKNVQGTVGVSTGKWYWESTISGGSLYYAVGVAISTKVTSTYDTGEYGIWMYDNRGYKIGEGGSNTTAYGATYTSGDVIGIALDSTTGTITFYKNNTSQGVAFTTGLAGVTVLPQFAVYYNGSANTQIANFGQQPFTYTPPSGFVALNTYNLSTPTISNGATQMAATTYTGTGATLTVANTVNTASFQPDFVWVKGRSGATDHALYDVLRGTTKQLESNNTAAETTEATGLTAFGSTGFTVGALAQMNTSAATYVGWQWKANGAGVTNTNGSLTSTVSANTTAGFSIATYTGTNSICTVGHGLGVAPSFIVAKSRTAAGGNWVVYHVSLGNTKIILLNLTDAASVNANGWNNLSPTSTVINFGAQDGVNGNCVAYSFAAVAGYSAFGSYTGNGSTDGPFVYTGFRPRFVVFKRTDSAENWQMYDSSRNPSNVVGEYLLANSSSAGSTITVVDFLSNGFKIRTDGGNPGVNTNGGTYIYACFAENPFKYSLAR